MRKIIIATAIMLTLATQSQAIVLVDYISDKIDATKEVVKPKLPNLTRKYECWKNDGYYKTYTTLFGITIQTFEKCEDSKEDN